MDSQKVSPVVTPAKAGVQTSSRPRVKLGVNSSREQEQRTWIPAFAGMTEKAKF
jgi:hypothetical protein